jgi:hypothetical protein
MNGINWGELMRRVEIRQILIAAVLFSAAAVLPGQCTAVTVDISPSLDGYFYDEDSTSGYEGFNQTDTQIRNARLSVRDRRGLMSFTLFYANIPTTATITSASLNGFTWSFQYQNPYSNAHVDFIGLEPIFGNLNAMSSIPGVTLATHVFSSTLGFSVPLDVAFLQSNLQSDLTFIIRTQMTNSGSDFSMSSTRHSVATSRPYLQITYEIPEPTSLVLMSLAIAAISMSAKWVRHVRPASH